MSRIYIWFFLSSTLSLMVSWFFNITSLSPIYLFNYIKMLLCKRSSCSPHISQNSERWGWFLLLPAESGCGRCLWSSDFFAILFSGEGAMEELRKEKNPWLLGQAAAGIACHPQEGWVGLGPCRRTTWRWSSCVVDDTNLTMRPKDKGQRYAVWEELTTKLLSHSLPPTWPPRAWGRRASKRLKIMVIRSVGIPGGAQIKEEN